MRKVSRTCYASRSLTRILCSIFLQIEIGRVCHKRRLRIRKRRFPSKRRLFRRQYICRALLYSYSRGLSSRRYTYIHRIGMRLDLK